MIKENELRIDNWVKDSRTNTLVQIGGIHVSGIIYVGDHDYDDWKRSIEPEAIPISEEILLKCGFRKDDFGPTEDYTWFLPVDPNDENNFLGKMSLTESFEYKFRDEYKDRSIKIESVHQLQNLYFFLTGEELSINLNEVVK